MKALCIIDVQKDFTSANHRFAIAPGQIESVIVRINQLSAEFKVQGMPVIYIRQINQSWAARLFSRVFTQGLGIQGSPGCELDPRLAVVSDLVFDKEKPSSFSSSEFAGFLKANQITQLAISGLDGCFCVNATASEALKKGIQVEILNDAIATCFPAIWAKLRGKLSKRGARQI